MATRVRGAPVIFDDPAHPLAAPLATWATDAPRLATFLVAQRDKIRKKARGARDPEALGDLLLELAVARDLHRGHLGTVGYEILLPGRTRVPDFALTLPNGTLAIVEVTRMRPSGTTSTDAESTESVEVVGVSAIAAVELGESVSAEMLPANLAARLTVLLCNKLSQLVPNTPNLLVVGVPPAWLPALDVAETLRDLLARAERRDMTPREQHPFRAPGDFFRYYRNLSALHIRPWPPAAPAPPMTLWLNRQATKPLPPKLRATFAALPDEQA